MAQGSGKTNGKNGRSGTGKSPQKRKPTGRQTSAKAAAQQPVRREITGGVLAFIGLFSLIAYFSVDALFINFIRKVIGGVVGWGFYIFAPVMFIGAYIMFFHKGRPVAFRLTAALLLPVLFGAMTNLLFSRADLASAGGFAAMVSLLYNDGAQLAFGGVVTGLLSFGLERVFSVYVAFPLLLIAFLYFLLAAWCHSRHQQVGGTGVVMDSSRWEGAPVFVRQGNFRRQRGDSRWGSCLLSAICTAG